MQLFLLLLIFGTFSLCTAQMAGGFENVNVAEYASHGWKSAPEINKGNSGKAWLVPIKVLKARTQVVAGTNTELEVLVGESSCQKTLKIAEVTAANCQFRKGGNRALFKVSIWEKPWEKFEQITAEKIRDVPASEII